MAETPETGDFQPGKRHTMDVIVKCQEVWQERADAVRLMTDRVDMFLEEHPASRRADCNASLQSLRCLAEVAGEYASRIRRLEDDLRCGGRWR